MKLNKRGFAVTGIIYSMLVLFLVLIGASFVFRGTSRILLLSIVAEHGAGFKD